MTTVTCPNSDYYYYWPNSTGPHHHPTFPSSWISTVAPDLASSGCCCFRHLANTADRPRSHRRYYQSYHHTLQVTIHFTKKSHAWSLSSVLRCRRCLRRTFRYWTRRVSNRTFSDDSRLNSIDLSENSMAFCQVSL